MNDALTCHLNNASMIPLLTPEEEIHHGRNVQAMMRLLDANPSGPYTKAERRTIAKGKRSRERMITANLRLVANVTRRFQRICKGMDITPEDMMQDGTLGLIRGVERFDPERGYKFSTYAYWWIRQGINRGIQQTGRTIRVPVHVTEVMLRAPRVREHLRSVLNRAPTVAELVEELGTTEAEYRHYNMVGHKVGSIDCLATEDGSPLIEILGNDETADDHLKALGAKIDRETIMRILNTALTDKQRFAIINRFGIGTDPKPYRDICKMMGCHHEAARQQVDRGLRRLRMELMLSRQVGQADSPEEPLYQPWTLRGDAA